MGRGYNTNVYLEWEQGLTPPVLPRLSALLIGPIIDVFEDKEGPIYTSDPNGTGTFDEYALPGFDPAVHQPVDISYWNSCGNRVWITELQNVAIRDSVDNQIYDIDSAYWFFNIAGGVVNVVDNVMINLGGDLTGIITDSARGNYGGVDGVIFRLSVNNENFPTFSNGARLRADDWISIPYWAYDYNNDTYLAEDYTDEQQVYQISDNYDSALKTGIDYRSPITHNDTIAINSNPANAGYGTVTFTNLNMTGKVNAGDYIIVECYRPSVGPTGILLVAGYVSSVNPLIIGDGAIGTPNSVAFVAGDENIINNITPGVTTTFNADANSTLVFTILPLYIDYNATPGSVIFDWTGIGTVSESDQLNADNIAVSVAGYNFIPVLSTVDFVGYEKNPCYLMGRLDTATGSTDTLTLHNFGQGGGNTDGAPFIDVNSGGGISLHDKFDGAVAAADSEYCLPVAFWIPKTWIDSTTSTTYLRHYLSGGVRPMPDIAVDNIVNSFLFMRFGCTADDYGTNGYLILRVNSTDFLPAGIETHPTMFHVWGEADNFDNTTNLTDPEVRGHEFTIWGKNPSIVGLYPITGNYVAAEAIFYQEPDVTHAPVLARVIGTTGDEVIAFLPDDPAVVGGYDIHVVPPVEMTTYLSTYETYRYPSGNLLVTYMVFRGCDPSNLSPIYISSSTDIEDNLGNIHPYNPLAFAAYLGLQNRTFDNNSVGFYVLPICEQSYDGFNDAIKILRKQANEVPSIGSTPICYYDLCALSMCNNVLDALKSFIDERSVPYWSDYRRQWAAEELPIPQEDKITNHQYSGAGSDILTDPTANFYEVNTMVGDYVRVLPANEYHHGTYAITVKENAMWLTFTAAGTDPSLLGRYVVFDDGSGNVYTGQVVRQLSALNYFIKLDSAIAVDIDANVTLYFFTSWQTFRVSEITSTTSLRVSGLLPTMTAGWFTPIYQLYSDLSEDEIRDIWLSYAINRNSERYNLVNPWVIVTWDDTDMTLPGFYLAAAKAVCSSARKNHSTPMSGWPVSGFKDVLYGDNYFEEPDVMQLALNGVDIHVQMTKQGPIKSRRQRTTYQSDTDTGRKEQNTVKVADYIAHVVFETVNRYTEKYNVEDGQMLKDLNLSLQALIKQWTGKTNRGGRDSSIVVSAKLVTLKPIVDASDLPDDFVPDPEIPFETGVLVELEIVHKNTNYRSPVRIFIQRKRYE